MPAASRFRPKTRHSAGRAGPQQAERESVFAAVRQAMEPRRLAGLHHPVPMWRSSQISVTSSSPRDYAPGRRGRNPAIRDYVGKIYMVEADQVVVNVEKVFRLTRLNEICARHNVTWVNMSRGDHVRVRDPQRLVLHDVRIPEILTRTELITLPLLKTHNKTTVTGAIKNQWGCLQALRHNFHPVLARALVDVNTLVQPRFAVMMARSA